MLLPILRRLLFDSALDQQWPHLGMRFVGTDVGRRYPHSEQPLYDPRVTDTQDEVGGLAP